MTNVLRAMNHLTDPRPDALYEIDLPRHASYYPSPVDWRNEILYFLLVDRFSDGQEADRPLLNRDDLPAARPSLPNGAPWRWDRWAASGADRWQGGTLQGVQTKLPYLKDLGVTTLWLSPVFKQRAHLDTYHGYGVQDFLTVDPRVGTREDLVALVNAAHDEGMRVILDIIFNHSGLNWVYPPGTPGGRYTPTYTSDRYPFGHWLNEEGAAVETIGDHEDRGVWPTELQDAEYYTRAGAGSLGGGDIDDPYAEHKRTDFITLRDFNLASSQVITDLARCYKYWIALTDCDGFRLDTLKHVSQEEARNFCGSVKEFAANLGKHNFFLLGEVAGGDYNQDRYLDVLERNLDATLDIGEMRLSLNGVAKGLVHPMSYFSGFAPVSVMGSHRNLGERHVSILDDHDHVFGDKVRFASDAASDHQIVVGVALQLFTLGIPCIYYGTEQALAGPEPAERTWLPDWKRSDRYLREALFGPDHPRKAGRDGMPDAAAPRDLNLPGFGPFGTAGRHCFDASHPAYRRIAMLTALRQAYPALRVGRQYLRKISFLGKPFAVYGPGEIMAWSRILDDEDMLCVANPHGTQARGADIEVDVNLNPVSSAMTVVANTAQATADGPDTGSHAVGEECPVRRTPDGRAYVSLRDIPPSEVLVLTNHPAT
jgi:glycosidase